MSETVQLNLRVPAELKFYIDTASRESGRSINAEAVYRLQQSFASESLPKEEQNRILQEFTSTPEFIQLMQQQTQLLGEINTKLSSPTQ